MTVHLASPQSDPRIREDVSEFLLDRELARRSPATLSWYREKLGAFADRLAAEGVTDPCQIERSHI